MNARGSSGFWVTNHLANPILRPLLRSRAGRRLGRHLAVLRYRGRRTGEPHELVVQYARDGDVIWVLPAHADRKTWWRNFRDPTDIEVSLAVRTSRREVPCSTDDSSPTVSRRVWLCICRSDPAHVRHWASTQTPI